MNHPLEIINQHDTIRETVGYEFISKVELYDLPSVMSFLEIVHNYMKMKKLIDK